MAVNSINQLIANVSTGQSGSFAKFNRWRVDLPFIPALGVAYDAEKLNIFCSSVSVPGRQITSFDYYTNLKGKYMAYGYGSASITLTFYVTSDWYAWKYINEWQSNVISRLHQLDGFKVGYFDNYAKNMTITNLGMDGKEKKKIEVIGAFPTTLNALEFNNDVSSSVHTCSAEFQFTHWVDLQIQQEERMKLMDLIDRD